MVAFERLPSTHTVIATGWTSPANAFADEATEAYATATPAKNGSVSGDFAGFGFATVVPADASLDGGQVTVAVTWKVSTTGSVDTLGAQVYVAGSPVGSEFTTTTLTTTERTDSFTVTGLTRGDLDNLTVRVRASRGNTNTAFTGSLGSVKVSGAYTEAPPAQALTLDVAPTATTAVDATATPGVAAATLDLAALAPAAPDSTLNAGPTGLVLDVATATAAAPDATTGTVAPPQALTLDLAALAAAGFDTAAAAGPRAATLDTATGLAGAADTTQTPGTVASTVDQATLTLTAADATTTGTPPPATGLTLDAATAALTGADLGLAPGPTSTGFDTAAAATTAPDPDIAGDTGPDAGTRCGRGEARYRQRTDRARIRSYGRQATTR